MRRPLRRATALVLAAAAMTLAAFAAVSSPAAPVAAAAVLAAGLALVARLPALTLALATFATVFSLAERLLLGMGAGALLLLAGLLVVEGWRASGPRRTRYAAR